MQYIVCDGLVWQEWGEVEWRVFAGLVGEFLVRGGKLCFLGGQEENAR